MKYELREFDAARYLDSDEAIVSYLEAIIEEDPDLLPVALGDVARAHGMAELARETGLARESLYQALSPTGNPTYSTLTKVLNVFGLRLAALPQKSATDAKGESPA